MKRPVLALMACLSLAVSHGRGAETASTNAPPAEILAQKQRNHWAFKAPVRPAPPPVADVSWSKTPVDRFILARWLDREGLKPSPEADQL